MPVLMVVAGAAASGDQAMVSGHELPIPPHFDPAMVGEVRRVPYQEVAAAAEAWARRHRLRPAAEDARKVCLLLVDVQNTFCIPGFELYVGGRSGSGAVDDNRRLCEFIYRNLASISRIVPTLDTHRPLHIFHAVFLVDEEGRHPPPFTQVSAADVAAGRWRFNAAIAGALGLTPEAGQAHLDHYVRRLQASGKYDLTVWPYHAMLGGLGHALVAAVEEAVFFHAIARNSQPHVHIKGDHPLTEHYSVLNPEVNTSADGRPLTVGDDFFIRLLIEHAAVIIAGQAKSHCVAWTISDLLDRIRAHDEALVARVYLLEDCTSSVVIPGVVDFTDAGDDAFHRFADAGMHVVRAALPMHSWPGWTT